MDRCRFQRMFDLRKQMHHRAVHVSVGRRRDERCGMNVGIMPITGIPLPLFSYGGSSVLTTFLAIGLLQSVYAQGRATAAAKGRVLGF